MEFDVSKYELEETAVLTVQDARGEDDMIGADGVNPVRITLYGGGSRQAVRAVHKAGQQAALRMAQLVRGKISKQAAVEAEEEQVEKLVTCTKSIDNFPVPAAELYANQKLGYITKQVVKFLEDDTNFAKPSTSNSASTSGNQPG
jgi:DNA-binding XRE family transcriptional regulator